MSGAQQDAQDFALNRGVEAADRQHVRAGESIGPILRFEDDIARTAARAEKRELIGVLEQLRVAKGLKLPHLSSGGFVLNFF